MAKEAVQNCHVLFGTVVIQSVLTSKLAALCNNSY